MSTVESIARPRRNGERRRAPTASISKESPAITGVVEMVIRLLAAAFPELNAWERAGADASSAGMVDAGFENQKELTKMQLDNQKEIAEMQNETQKEIAGIQSATSR